MAWSDSEKEEESDNDDESENFTIFMTSTTKVTKTSLKAPKIEKSNESEGTIGFLEEESYDEDKCELQ